MSRKIRFPLKMANGAEARTLEELTENFDLTSVLGYYEDGKLINWLRDRYHDTEADKLEALDKNSKSFTSDFCAIFGVEMNSEEAEDGADIDYIARRNEKKKILRTITDDESVIYNVDSIALDQNDLLDLYDEGKKDIYLCKGEFEIPLSITNVTYHGIVDPIVTIRVTDNVNFNEKNIKFVDCVYGWDVSKTSPLDGMKRAEYLFSKGDFGKAAGVLEKFAEQGNPRAIMLLCHIYEDMLPDKDKLNKWSEKAKQSHEVCNVIDNIESGTEKYFALLKKLADKGDTFFEYYYASALHKYERYHFENEDVDEMIEFYRSRSKEMKNYYSFSVEKGNVVAMYELGYCLEKGLGVIFDEKAAAELYLKAAEKGSIYAMIKLGDCYKSGCGVEKDDKKTIEWYTKAAELGNAEAQCMLGEQYKWKCNDINKAIKWYTKAAEQGNIKAQKFLVYIYNFDRHGNKDSEKSMMWTSKLAEQGNRGGQYGFGCSYYDQEDYKTAVKWFKKAADQGEWDAMLKLAECYYYGFGLESDNKKALEVVLSYAEQENDQFDYSKAENIMGNIYYNGLLTDTNYGEAVRWYKKAAENGCDAAYYNLAYCYYIGNGVSQSNKDACKLLIEAAKDGRRYDSELGYPFKNIFDDDAIEYQDFFDLYEEPAQNGDANAQFMLGSLWYYYGKNDGIGRNYEEAAKWYARSAEQGNADAQYQLAECYEDGDGVEENEEISKDWRLKSAVNGNDSAIYDILRIFENYIYDENTEQIKRLLPFIRTVAQKDNDNAKRACILLGDLYSDNLLGEKNTKEAIMWYTKGKSIYSIRDILLVEDDTVTN